MAVSAITAAKAQSTQTATPVAASTKPQQTQSSVKPQAPAPDSVNISAAARALQELTENSAQTSKEAASGDRQAQRLLAKETAK